MNPLALYFEYTPGAVLTVVFGVWLWLGHGFSGSWLHAKLALVLILIYYHYYCGKFVKAFKNDANQHGHVFYRWFNEFPVLVLFAVVILVVVKPDLVYIINKLFE